MKLTKAEAEILADALTRHIDELETYCPPDQEERVKLANDILCKIGYQKLVRRIGITRSWDVYVPIA